jgi:hypothetical protein
MYKGWAIKFSPCNATFNDLLCFCYTVKPVLNGISRVQNIFPLKPGFRLTYVYYDSHGTWKYFRLIKGPFKTGFTVFCCSMTMLLFLVPCHVRVFTSSSICFPVEDFLRYYQMRGSDFLQQSSLLPKTAIIIVSLSFYWISHHCERFRIWFNLFRSSVRHWETDIIFES